MINKIEKSLTDWCGVLEAPDFDMLKDFINGTEHIGFFVEKLEYDCLSEDVVTYVSPKLGKAIIFDDFDYNDDDFSDNTYPEEIAKFLADIEDRINAFEARISITPPKSQ